MRHDGFTVPAVSFKAQTLVPMREKERDADGLLPKSSPETACPAQNAAGRNILRRQGKTAVMNLRRYYAAGRQTCGWPYQREVAFRRQARHSPALSSSVPSLLPSKPPNKRPMIPTESVPAIAVPQKATPTELPFMAPSSPQVTAPGPSATFPVCDVVS